MYFSDVLVGESIEIGDVACIRVDQKSGPRVRLAIATKLSPIRINPTGHIPEHYTLGMTNELKPIRPKILSST